MNGLGIIFSTVAMGSFAVAAVSAVSRLFSGVRVWYRDGQYLVSVRRPGDWHDVREFVTPHDSRVQALYSKIGPDIWAALQWVCQNVSYRRDIGEFWQFPFETARGGGDCEDSAILLTSLLKNFTNAYVVLGDYQGWGHAWVASEEGEILEATYTEARAVPDPDNYYPYVMFNDIDVVELWSGALREVFELRRNEATKLNLMAHVQQGVLSSNPGYIPGARVPGGLYAELPEACYCSVCGYTVTNPGVHCPELGPCPICHSPRLWRVK